VGSSPESKVAEKVEITRYANLSTPLKVLFLLLTLVGVGLAVCYNFSISVWGAVLSDIAFYYLSIMCFLSLVFLLLPARKKKGQRRSVA